MNNLPQERTPQQIREALWAKQYSPDEFKAVKLLHYRVSPWTLAELKAAELLRSRGKM